jgi:hypothetical protein
MLKLGVSSLNYITTQHKLTFNEILFASIFSVLSGSQNDITQLTVTLDISDDSFTDGLRNYMYK